MNTLSILLATDFSEDSRRLPATALKVFGDRLGEVVLLHVLPRSMPAVPMLGSGAQVVAPPFITHSGSGSDSNGTQNRLEEIKSEFGDGVRVSSMLKHGWPAFVICETAAEQGSDLILLASHGHQFLRRLLLGSTARYVMNHAPCDVLILRPTAGGCDPGAPFVASAPEEFSPAASRHPIPTAAGRVA